MGRAFRVTKRTAHLTVRVAERPLKITRVAEENEAAPARRRAGAASGATSGAKKRSTPKASASPA
jgi:hypothetical protein